MLKQWLKLSLLICACYAALSLYFMQPTPQASTLSDGGWPQAPKKGGQFPHGQSGKNGLRGHRELACSICHLIEAQAPYKVTGKPSPKVEAPVESPFPGHASCVECHNFALMSFVKPAFCGICHQQNPLSPSQPGLFPTFQTETGAGDFGTAFSHVAHRQTLPQALQILPAAQRSPGLAQSALQPGSAPLCTDCHAPVQPLRIGQPELITESGHPNCFTCHLQAPVGLTAQSGKPFPARGDCQGCHALTEQGAPKQHSPGLFEHFKVMDFRHADHEFDTRSVKKSEAQVVKPRDYLCAECHQTAAQAKNLNDIQAPGLSACTSCHNEKRKPGLPDPLRAEVRRTLRDKD